MVSLNLAKIEEDEKKANVTINEQPQRPEKLAQLANQQLGKNPHKERKNMKQTKIQGAFFFLTEKAAQ